MKPTFLLFALVAIVGCTRPTVAPKTISEVTIVATVSAYENSAEWDHFADGSHAVYDQLALTVETPEQYAGKEYFVSVSPGVVSQSSPFRNSGTRMRFGIDAAELKTDTFLWGVVENPRVIE